MSILNSGNLEETQGDFFFHLKIVFLNNYLDMLVCTKSVKQLSKKNFLELRVGKESSKRMDSFFINILL